MDKKKFFIGISIFLGFVLLYILFGMESGTRETANESEALSALMGGGGGISGRVKNSEGSMFDSNFWEAGVPDTAIDTSNVQEGGNDTGLLDPASEGNPINPQTGQPYPDSVMNQFSALREKFPNNRLIPRKITPEEKAAEDARKIEIAQIQQKISSGNAGPQEVNQYYDYQGKSIDDRLELLNYILESQGSTMDDDIKAKFTNILDLNKKQKEENEAARNRALNPGSPVTQENPAMKVQR